MHIITHYTYLIRKAEGLRYSYIHSCLLFLFRHEYTSFRLEVTITRVLGIWSCSEGKRNPHEDFYYYNSIHVVPCERKIMKILSKSSTFWICMYVFTTWQCNHKKIVSNCDEKQQEKEIISYKMKGRNAPTPIIMNPENVECDTWMLNFERFKFSVFICCIVACITWLLFIIAVDCWAFEYLLVDVP